MEAVYEAASARERINIERMTISELRRAAARDCRCDPKDFDAYIRSIWSGLRR